MLLLANQQKVSVKQEVIFDDIDITIKEIEEIKKEIAKMETNSLQKETPTILPDSISEDQK